MSLADLSIDGWESGTLADGIDLLVGPAFESKLFTSDRSAVRLLRGVNVSRGFTRWTGETEKRWKQMTANLKRYLLAAGDVVVGMDGALIGRNYAAISDSDLPCLLVQRVARLRANERLEQRFIYHLISHPAFHLHIDKYKTHTAIPHMSSWDIFNYPIPLPPIEEQRRIAEILDTADEAIQKTEALIAKLKQMKAGLLHDLLTRGIDENGELRQGIARWDYAELGEVCSLIKDGTHLPPKRVPNGPLLLSVQNMKNGELVSTEADTRVSEAFYESMHKNWQIQVGDVLLAVVGATLGKAARVTPLPKFTLQRSVAVLRGTTEVLSNDFLYLTVISDSFQRMLWQGVNQTAQPGIYLNELSKTKIRIADWNEQIRIVNVLRTHEDRIRKEQQTCEKLVKLKAGLMHDLLTGKKRVSQLQPASA